MSRLGVRSPGFVGPGCNSCSADVLGSTRLARSLDNDLASRQGWSATGVGCGLARCVPSAVGAIVAAAVGSRVARGTRARKTADRRRMAANAVVEDDVHSQVVRRWIDELVIGEGFCPWAKPAGQDGHIRVVTSTADSEDGVLADLISEGLLLPPGCETPPKGQASTTVLVAPYILEWATFSNYNRFYQRVMENGTSLVRTMGLRVVGFHPQYTRCTSRYFDGERVEVNTSNGVARAMVTRAEIGLDATGHALMEVRLEDASTDSVLTIQMPGCSAADLSASCWKDLALRAPRPALHLLRTGDLDKAAQDLGQNMFTDALFVRNERIAREFGADWAARLMLRCEEPSVAHDVQTHGNSSQAQCPEWTVDPLASETPGSALRGLVVMWCDVDPDIKHSVSLLAEEGLQVLTFLEPEQLLAEYQRRAPECVGVMSSMMEGGGRKERAAMNAFALFAACRERSSAMGVRPPVFAVVSLSADREAAIAAGADIVVYGNRIRAQKQLLQQLRERQSGFNKRGQP